MNILYQFNEAYSVFAGVSIASLLENNRQADEVNIYVFDEEISEDSKNKLTRLVEGYGQGRCISFIDISKLVEKMKVDGLPSYRGSYSANARMFAGNILTKLDRLLYLDADTIIEADIREFYNTDLKGKALGCVLDVLGGYHKQLIGIPENGDYINSGMLLYDLEAYRNHNCEEKILFHVKNVRAHYMAPDQDLLNVVLGDDMRIMDIRYNLQTPFFAYDYDKFMRNFPQSNMYTREAVVAALDSPAIIHTFRFLGEFPWHKNNIHPCKSLFDKYLKLTPWTDYERQPSNQNSFTFKVERIMYRVLPQGVFLWIFRIFYMRFIKSAEELSQSGENAGKM